MADTGPLDEVVHTDPGLIHWWLSIGCPHMHENFIHRYFAASPYFNWKTKNGIWVDHALKGVMPYPQLLYDRPAFEEQLRQHTGEEYMIVEEPQPVKDQDLAAQGVTTGIWVIRHQQRDVIPPSDEARETYDPKTPSVIFETHPNGKDRSKLTVLGTYYIVGEAIYQAPNVYDVVSSRLLAATSSLNRFLDIAESLPQYTPARGHHYTLQSSSKPTTDSASATDTPARSREGSLAPAEDRTSMTGSVQPDGQSAASTNAANVKESSLLATSLIWAVQYGDEYTDENPLVGEPGNFRFTTSSAVVKKRRLEEEAAVAKARAEKESASVSQISSPKLEKAVTIAVTEVPDAFSTAKASAKEKSGKDERKSGGKEKKRKKSRAHNSGTATSPTTPGSATSPQSL